MMMKKKIGMVVKWKNILKRIFEIAAMERSDSAALHTSHVSLCAHHCYKPRFP